MNWGIAETASEIKKIKSESADYLNGLNSCGVIDWNTYNYAFDFYADLLMKAYEQGRKDAQPEPPEDICGECDAWNKYKSEHKTGRWIPVSERMPEDGEKCLVSVRCSNNFLVDRGTYSTDLFNVDEEDFFGNRGESGWYYLSSEYGYCKILNVIAWMPEPRPYKEIKDERFN